MLLRSSGESLLRGELSILMVEDGALDVVCGRVLVFTNEVNASERGLSSHARLAPWRPCLEIEQKLSKHDT